MRLLSLPQLHRKDIASLGDDLLLTHDIRLWDLFAEPCRIDGYAIIVCMAGEMEVSINGVNHHIGPDTLAVDFPENVVCVSSHTDVDAYAVLLSRRLFASLEVDLTQLSRFYTDFRSHVVFPLPHAELLPLQHYFALLRHNASRPCADRAEIVRSLLRAGVYQLFAAIEASQAIRLASMRTQPERAAQLFADFLSVLSAECRKQRTVQYYASKLCLTPRHLSEVIRGYSGRSVSEWVADYVAQEAKRMLADPAFDVQEVSRALNFPSQSAFGKYFKKATGSAPRDFRKKRTFAP